jgi:hypothetical protein
MSIRTQLIIIALLSIFIVTPLMGWALGYPGIIVNAIITISLFVKYGNTEDE